MSIFPITIVETLTPPAQESREKFVAAEPPIVTVTARPNTDPRAGEPSVGKTIMEFTEAPWTSRNPWLFAGMCMGIGLIAGATVGYVSARRA